MRRLLLHILLPLFIFILFSWPILAEKPLDPGPAINTGETIDSNDPQITSSSEMPNPVDYTGVELEPIEPTEPLGWYLLFPLNSLYHAASLTLDTSYAWGEGNMYDFTVQSGIPKGVHLNYLVELELNGYHNGNDLKTYLYYPSLGDREFTLHLMTPNWTVEYDQLEIAFPKLNTTIAKQEIKGLRVARTDQTTDIFYGTKLYKSKSFTETIWNENQFKYSLFEPTSGDMVELSEVVFLQGRRLTRYTDYKVNYLDGTLTLLTPLRQMDVIEVKYSFIPQGEDVQDQLGGLYYQWNVDGSSASVFYFHQMEAETTLEMDANFEMVEVFNESFKNYLGTALNLVQDQYTLTGEMTWTKTAHDPSQEKPDHGGQIQLDYHPNERFNLDYQLTTATEEYEGIGPVVIAAGDKHEVTSTYQINPDWEVDLMLAQVEKKDGLWETHTRIGEGSLHYQFHPRHQTSLTLQARSIDEWGETTTTSDYLLGWKYQITDDLVFSLQNSVQEPRKNEFHLDMDTYKFRLASQYKQYQELGSEIWFKEANADLMYRPFSGVTITGDLDYLQDFDLTFADSKRRLALMVLATPNKKISTRSNYVYFYNPDTLSQTLFYDTNTTLVLPYDVQWDFSIDHIHIESETVSNIQEKWNTAFQIPILERLTAFYELGQKDHEEFLKITQWMNRDSDTLAREYGLSYLVTDQFSTGISYEKTIERFITGTSQSNEEEDRIDLNMNYFAESNIFEYQLSYLHNLTKDQFIHKISWENQLGPLFYNYEANLTVSNLNGHMSNHQEKLTAQWDAENSPYKPSIDLMYLAVDDEEQTWTKHKVAVKLTYELSQDQNIFVEIGDLGLYNPKKPEKTYDANYIRTGIEYIF